MNLRDFSLASLVITTLSLVGSIALAGDKTVPLLPGKEPYTLVFSCSNGMEILQRKASPYAGILLTREDQDFGKSYDVDIAVTAEQIVVTSQDKGVEIALHQEAQLPAKQWRAQVTVAGASTWANCFVP